MGKPHYLTLDGARGVAAMAILVLHTGDMTGLALLPGAYLAVDFFFVLSGFVVATAYEDRLVEGMGLGAFTVIRLRRLYPLYLIGTLIGLGQVLVFSAVRHSVSHPAGLALSLAAALLMLPGPIPGVKFIFPLNVPAWSLFFEMAVNLVYARVVRRLSMAVLLAIVALGFAGMVGAVVDYHSLDAGPRWRDLWVGFVRVCFCFFAGVALRRLLRDKAPRQSNAAALIVLGALAFTLAEASGHSPLDLMVVVAVLPGLVGLGALVQPYGLLAGVCRRAGRLSYALYAVHYPVIDTLRPALHALGLPAAVTVTTMAAAACAAAVACDALLSIAPWRPAKSRRPQGKIGAPLTAADAG